VDARQRAELDGHMARLADGERAAFEPVYDTLWPIVRAFVARAVGSGPDAEDAAQSALLKLFAQASDYEPGRSVLTWALAIAAWEIRTVRKRRQRAPRVVETDADVLHADAPSAEDVLARNELDAAVQAALAALSPADRAALVDSVHAEAFGPRTPRERKRKERALARLRAIFFGGRHEP